MTTLGSFVIWPHYLGVLYTVPEAWRYALLRYMGFLGGNGRKFIKLGSWEKVCVIGEYGQEYGLNSELWVKREATAIEEYISAEPYEL